MTIWRCIKTVTMNTNPESVEPAYVAFTRGRLYKAGIGYTPGGERMLLFVNDRGEAHLAGGKWLFEHFERVEE